MPYQRPRPGEACVYHTGFLLADRHDTRRPDWAAVEGAATAAWRDYAAGLVTLVQRQVSGPTATCKFTTFEYIAVGLREQEDRRDSRKNHQALLKAMARG